MKGLLYKNLSGGDHKPNSVYAAIYLGRALPRASSRPTRNLERAVLNRLLTWSCTGWGLHCRHPYGERGELLPRLFTLTGPVIRRRPQGTPPTTRPAVYFLLHFPSPRGARALPGILPCGVRTFLTSRTRRDSAAACSPPEGFSSFPATACFARMPCHQTKDTHHKEPRQAIYHPSSPRRARCPFKWIYAASMSRSDPTDRWASGSSCISA